MNYTLQLWEAIQAAEASGYRHLARTLRSMLAQELLRRKGSDFFAALLPVAEGPNLGLYRQYPDNKEHLTQLFACDGIPLDMFRGAKIADASISRAKLSTFDFRLQ